MPIGRHLTRGPVDVLQLLGPLFCLCWLVGWLAKDRFPSLIWFYFIPVVSAASVSAIYLFMARGKNWRVARFFVAPVFLLALAKILAVDFEWHSARPDTANTMRVVHWNTARRFRKAPAVFQTIARDRPDICVLSESPRVTNLYELGRSDLGLDYVLDDQGMTIFSRYPFVPLGTVPITTGRAWVVRVTTPQGPLDVMAFDLVSHPTLDRFPPMRQLAEWVAGRGTDIPLMILGDFNTPRDSASFEPLRLEMRNAYEIGGDGWPYSWPVPFPVYAIDHAWVSPSVQVLDHAYKTSFLSDHRRQILNIRL